MSVCAFCLALPAAVCDRLASREFPSILLPPRLDTSLQSHLHSSENQLLRSGQEKQVP